MTDDELKIERREINARMARKIDNICEILNGNGKMGLVAKVEVIWGVGLFLVITVLGLVIEKFIR